METVEELGEKFLKRFEKMHPTLYLKENGAVLCSLRLHDVFRVLVNPVGVLLTNYESIERAFERDPNWVDGHIYQSLPAEARNGLMLFVVGGGGKEARVRRRMDEQVVSMDQPLIPANAFFARKKSPHESIRDAIVQHLAVKHFSPYRIDQVAGKKMFFGRDHVLNRLLTGKGSQVIFGPRRIGKSSLARRLQALLGKVDRFREKPMLKCSYVDVSALGNDASLLIWNSILTNFNLERQDFAAGGRIARLAGGRKEVRSPYVDEAHALESLIKAFPGQLTIILDEVDKWIEAEAPLKWATLNRLRAMSDEGKAQILLIGYESLALASEHHNFPFAGRGRQLPLDPLGQMDVEHLVVEPLSEMGLRFSGQDQILNLIWLTSSGMPHIVQDICAEIVPLALDKRGEKTVTMDLLKTAIDNAHTVATLRNSVMHSPFPLAEAIAGVLSLASSGAATEIAEEQAQRTKNQMTIANVLSEFDNEKFENGQPLYVHDARDLERALAYLQIRFVLQPTDGSRTQWKWVNESARNMMREMIEKTGKQRWLQDLLIRHRDGTWRQTYQALESGGKAK